MLGKKPQPFTVSGKSQSKQTSSTQILPSSPIPSSRRTKRDRQEDELAALKQKEKEIKSRLEAATKSAALKKPTQLVVKFDDSKELKTPVPPKVQKPQPSQTSVEKEESQFELSSQFEGSDFKNIQWSKVNRTLDNAANKRGLTIMTDNHQYQGSSQEDQSVIITKSKPFHDNSECLLVSSPCPKSPASVNDRKIKPNREFSSHKRKFSDRYQTANSDSGNDPRDIQMRNHIAEVKRLQDQAAAVNQSWKPNGGTSFDYPEDSFAAHEKFSSVSFQSSQIGTITQNLVLVQEPLVASIRYTKLAASKRPDQTRPLTALSEKISKIISNYALSPAFDALYLIAAKKHRQNTRAEKHFRMHCLSKVLAVWHQESKQKPAKVVEPKPEPVQPPSDLVKNKQPVTVVLAISPKKPQAASPAPASARQTPRRVVVDATVRTPFTAKPTRTTSPIIATVAPASTTGSTQPVTSKPTTKESLVTKRIVQPQKSPSPIVKTTKPPTTPQQETQKPSTESRYKSNRTAGQTSFQSNIPLKADNRAKMSPTNEGSNNNQKQRLKRDVPLVMAKLKGRNEEAASNLEESRYSARSDRSSGTAKVITFKRASPSPKAVGSKMGSKSTSEKMITKQKTPERKGIKAADPTSPGSSHRKSKSETASEVLDNLTVKSINKQYQDDRRFGDDLDEEEEVENPRARRHSYLTSAQPISIHESTPASFSRQSEATEQFGASASKGMARSSSIKSIERCKRSDLTQTDSTQPHNLSQRGKSIPVLLQMIRSLQLSGCSRYRRNSNSRGSNTV